MNPQPFPWHLVTQTTHGDIALASHARSFFDRHNADRILARLNELVRAPVDIRLQSVTSGALSLRTGAIAVALADEKNRFVVVIDAALAAAAVMRTMKRSPPRVIDPSRTPPAALAGAFAAILVAASRAGLGPLHVAWCGDASDLPPNTLPDRVVDIHALAVVDDDAFETHLYVADDFFRSSRSALFTSVDLIALGAIPIALQLVASAATAPRREIDSLVKGDVWMPETFLTRALSGNFFGDVVLAAPTSERGARARLADDGSLVLLEGTEEMTMTGEEDAIVGNTGDAPLVVRVEVGSVTLTAREWSALKAGDVIATKNKISDPVVLRVGGVEVARGELVSVDGHVGVRIETRS
jgi:flagellar motor switch/type III secretory pathway protein FliN